MSYIIVDCLAVLDDCDSTSAHFVNQGYQIGLRSSTVVYFRLNGSRRTFDNLVRQAGSLSYRITNFNNRNKAIVEASRFVPNVIPSRLPASFSTGGRGECLFPVVPVLVIMHCLHTSPLPRHLPAKTPSFRLFLLRITHFQTQGPSTVSRVLFSAGSTPLLHISVVVHPLRR